MQKNDEMEKIQEWQEHQYNPFYWINRYSPLFPPRRSRGFWIISLIDLLLIIPAFLVTCRMYFADPNIHYLPFMVLFGALSVVMTLRAIRLRPEFTQKKRRSKIDEINHLKQEKKKKLPKRRKDYR